MYRQSDHTYYVIGSQTGDPIYKQWGAGGDVPVPGDYTHNPHSAYAVWRPSTGTLYAIDRYDTLYAFQWGTAGDIPVAAGRVR